jgi:sugar phosphate isomerase/epimerase
VAAAFGTEVIELCALGSSTIESLTAYLAGHSEALERFAYVSVHAPAQEAVGRWHEVAPQLVDLRVDTVVVHPDLVDVSALALLRPLGARLCFENMDCTKSEGRFPDELKDVFGAFPEAGFCLDVAHVWTNDRSLRLAKSLLSRFGQKLRQVHLSGIDEDAIHRPTTRADLERYAPLLDLCRGAPIILETELQP